MPKHRARRLPPCGNGGRMHTDVKSEVDRSHSPRLAAWQATGYATARMTIKARRGSDLSSVVISSCPPGAWPPRQRLPQRREGRLVWQAAETKLELHSCDQRSRPPRQKLSSLRCDYWRCCPRWPLLLSPCLWRTSLCARTPVRLHQLASFTLPTGIIFQ